MAFEDFFNEVNQDLVCCRKKFRILKKKTTNTKQTPSALCCQNCHNSLKMLRLGAEQHVDAFERCHRSTKRMAEDGSWAWLWLGVAQGYGAWSPSHPGTPAFLMSCLFLPAPAFLPGFALNRCACGESPPSFGRMTLGRLLRSFLLHTCRV